MKSKNILSRGVLPTLQIKRIGPIGYLIVADYVEQMRVYNFSRQGGLIAGDNVDPTPRLLKQLKKTTTLVYQLPKKEPITHLDDSTAQLQNLFRKHLARINHLLGANVIFPYTVIIAPYKKVNPITRNFGCEFKGHRFEMPSDTLSLNMGDISIVQAIFYQYLSSLIIITEPGLEPALNDLAIIFTYLYFNLQYKKVLFNALKLDFAYPPETKEYKFTVNAKDLLKFNWDGENPDPCILSRQAIQNVFRSLHTMLSFFPKYQFILNPENFYALYRVLLYEIKTSITQLEFEHEWTIKDRNWFFSNVFADSDFEPIFRTQTIQLTKDAFEEKVNEYASIIAKLQSTNQVRKLRELISDYVLKKLLDQIITFEVFTNFESTHKLWNFKFTLCNVVNYTLYNFSVVISWHPKSRLKARSLPEVREVEIFSRDIDLLGMFEVLTMGLCTLTITITVQNPLFPNHTVSYEKQYQYHFFESS